MVPFGGGLARRDAREVRRELSRLNASGRLDLARIDQAVVLQAAKAEGIAEVAAVAMTSVTRATLHAQQLSQAVPAAAGRINAIADALTVAEIGIVQNTVWRMR